MARDYRMENRLTAQGVEWDYLAAIPLAQINVEAGLRNQARLSEPLRKGTVAQYARALLDGAVFPAVVLLNGPKGFEPADGNHRIAALIAAGRKETDAYLVANADTYVRDRLIRTTNLVEGMRPSSEESLAQAIYLVETYKRPIKEVAWDCQLDDSVISRAIRVRETAQRLVAAGGRPEALNKTQLERLAVVHNDMVLKAAADLAIRASLKETEVASLTSSIQAKRTEQDQLESVRAATADYKERIGQTRSGRHPSSNQHRDTLLRSLATLQRLVSENPTLEQLQCTNPADARRVAVLWAAVRMLMEVAIGENAKPQTDTA
jgi:ParB-like chromosome segregation protein Spo0J